MSHDEARSGIGWVLRLCSADSQWKRGVVKSLAADGMTRNVGRITEYCGMQSERIMLCSATCAGC